MKKTWLFSVPCVFAALAASSTASASSEETVPGILYVPTETVTIYPGTAGTAECVGAGGATATQHSGLGCTTAVDEATEFAPYVGATNLTENLTGALAPFDITVTNTRPPKYVPFTMLIPSDEVSADSLSNTCAPAGIDCSTLTRKRIGFTIGGSMNCMAPDPLHAALYAFGRMSGLEGTDEATDPMFYPPDYTMPATEYQDVCANIVTQILFDKDGNPMPAANEECAATDAHNECEQPKDDNDPRMQNSFQHMAQAYGAAADDEDTEAPTIEITAPADGDVIMAEEATADVMFTVTVADNVDTFVGAMWTLTSPALLDAGLASDTIEVCTNQACAVEFADAPAHAKAIDSDFSFGGAFPPGEYTLSFEASDMHGNVAEPVSVTFTIEGAPSGTGTGGGTGGVDETGGTPNDDTAGGSSPFETGADGDGSGDDGTGGGSGGEDDDAGGCACNTGAGRGGLVALMFGLLGLGLSRRRS